MYGVSAYGIDVYGGVGVSGIFSGWVKSAKKTTSWGSDSKLTTSWSKDGKNSSIWTKQFKEQ